MLNRPSKDPESGRCSHQSTDSDSETLNSGNQTILGLAWSHVIGDNVSTTNGMIFITNGIDIHHIALFEIQPII